MGLAHLADGTTIDYDVYIKLHPHWQEVRQKRFAFDDGRCVICHKDLHDAQFETHHLSYDHLGNEHYRDVITLCSACHATFHNNWQKAQFWKGKEAGHWEAYNLTNTAKLCARYWKKDRLICKDPSAPNLCNTDVCKQLIDDYFKEEDLVVPVIIDPNDIQLFVRNKRWELYFEAEKRGLTVEQWMDEYYGQKVRGKNPIRSEASKSSSFNHEPKRMHVHYKENKNILKLMEEAKKYEQAE